MYLQDDKPIRVLMISPQFYPLVGGYERAAERLSVALAEAGMRVVVIAERRDSAWPASGMYRWLRGAAVALLVSSSPVTPSPACFLSPASCCATAVNLTSGMCINMVLTRRWLWRWARCCVGRWC